MSVSQTFDDVVVILLAAGLSTRAKPHNKLIAPVPGSTLNSPIIRVSTRSLLASSAGSIIVVTGHQSQEIENALAGLDVRFINNPNFTTGIAGSLSTGINAVPETSAAAIVALGDMPNLSPKTVDALIYAFSPPEGNTICVPVHNGKRGNPVLFGREHFTKLAGLSGDRGGKSVVTENPASAVEVSVDDPGIHIDYDTV